MSDRLVVPTVRRSRKMVGGRKMSDMETIRLVELYREHELLWNTNHPDYTLRARRCESYRALMEEMDMDSVDEVKKKIKSLRDTYTAERNRNIKSGGQYQIKLVWYDLLDQFLSPVAQHSVVKKVSRVGVSSSRLYIHHGIGTTN